MEQNSKKSDTDVRLGQAEETVEYFREVLRASVRPEMVDDCLAGFEEIVKLLYGMSRVRSEKLFEARVTYGSRVVTLGPTASRDTAAGLARSWMDSHAGTSKGSAVTRVDIDEIEKDGGS